MAHFLIKTLFLDIGGVLLTNGWGHELRERVAQDFGFDYEEFSQRHAMVFDLFERGRMTFDHYLEWTIFYVPRPFTLEEIKTYAYEAARPFPETIAYLKELKRARGLQVALLSNEGRELSLDRIERFSLYDLADFFIMSAFVDARKPEHKIYHMALDIAHRAPTHVCYLDDRAHLIEVGRSLGLHAIHHTSLESTRTQIEKLL